MNNTVIHERVAKEICRATEEGNDYERCSYIRSRMYLKRLECVRKYEGLNEKNDECK